MLQAAAVMWLQQLQPLLDAQNASTTNTKNPQTRHQPLTAHTKLLKAQIARSPDHHPKSRPPKQAPQQPQAAAAARLLPPALLAPPQVGLYFVILQRLGVVLNHVALQLVVADCHLEANRRAGRHVSDNRHCGLDVHEVVGLWQVQELLELDTLLLRPVYEGGREGV